MATRRDRSANAAGGRGVASPPGAHVPKLGPRVERHEEGGLFIRVSLGQGHPVTLRVDAMGEVILRRANVVVGQHLPPGMFTTLSEGGHLSITGEGMSHAGTTTPRSDAPRPRVADRTGTTESRRVVQVAGASPGPTTRPTSAARPGPGPRPEPAPARDQGDAADRQVYLPAEAERPAGVHPGWRTIDDLVHDRIAGGSDEGDPGAG